MKSRIKQTKRISRQTQKPNTYIKSLDHNLYNFTFEILEFDQDGPTWEIIPEQDKNTYLPDWKFVFEEE